MASKKYIFMLGLISLFFSAAIAQGDASYDWKDSSKIPSKRLPQHSEFANNNYPYPAKPRSMWELGFSAGMPLLWGDIAFKPSFGGGISLRKAISHTFSVRAGYTGMYLKGDPTTLGRRRGQVSYRNWTHMANLDLIASLNPISPYRGNPKWNWYILAGMDLIASRVFYERAVGVQLDGGYSVFYGIRNRPGVGRGTQSGLITTFGGAEVNGRKGWSLLSGGSFGAGFSVKLSKRINIGLEHRYTLTGYDYLDGIKPDGSGSNDLYSYTSGRLNWNIGKSSKRVEPLWWINPNNYVYNELNRPSHFKIPAPVLPDTDGDGVTDQFDMEPNSPAGVPVDVRGVARDTDGDGVPDYKDKELLTPSKCFPVDADGVGNCPEPACCKELRDIIANGGGTGGTGGGTGGSGNCNMGNLPSVQFKSGSAVLSKDAMNLLKSAAAQVKAVPTCRVKVTGHGASTKASQQLSWDRVNAVIRYLVEKQGINENRFIFTYGEDGDANTVDLMGTTETGPNRVEAPHPNLKSK